MKTSTLHLLAPLACAAALCLAQPAQAVTTLSGSASTANVAQGGTAVVTVTLDLSDPIDVLGFTLTVDWSSGALAVDTATVQVFGQSLATFAAQYLPAPFSDISSDDHHLGISLLMLPPPPAPSLPSGQSTIQLSFQGLQVGNYTVQYSLSLTDAGFNDIPADFSGSVNVSAVPEPSPAALLAAGIAVLGLLARRKFS